MIQLQSDHLFLILLAIFIGLSQAAGQGGGPVITVCLMIGLGYSTKRSIHYSYVIMLGASISSIIQNFLKSRLSNKSQIDFELILITLPMMISGSIVGVMLKQFMSQLLRTIFFTLLILSLIIKSIKNHQNLLKKQSKIVFQKQQNQLILNSQSLENNYQTIKLDNKQNQSTIKNLLIIMMIISYTAIIQLIRGGPKFSSIFGFQPCKLQFWICNSIHFLFSFIISFSINEQYHKKKKGINQQQIIHQNFYFLIITGLFAGIAGGALGLGGATVLAPSWMSLEMKPSKVITNTIPLIFSTSLSLFIIGLVSNAYNFTEVIQFFILSFISSLLIRKLVDYCIQKFEIKSAVNMLLIFIFATSLSVLEPYQIRKYFQNQQQFLQFGQFC